MPRPASTEPRVRLNLEMSERVRERLDRVRDLTEADSITEVIRRSASVYEALLLMVTQGGKLVLRRPDGTEQDLLL
jgi:hypothetical protein